MSFPKKANGWRSITIEKRRFRWCFQTGEKSSTLKLQGNISSGQQVIVTLEGWRDPWLLIPNKQTLPNAPKVITAKFVNEAIRFALTQGWKPHEAQPPLLISFIDGAFVLNNEV